MIFEEFKLEEVLGLIDKKELVQLALDLGNIYAPTGYEREIGEFIFNWLKANGFETMKQEVVKDRFNIIGTYKGSGNGLDLIFNSHMDTDIGAPEDIWMVSEIGPIYNKAWVKEPIIYGRSVVNDRGMMAAFMIAARAIKESGVKLKGNLILTMVPGEIGMAPVDEFQGNQYLGKGIGTKHLVTHGIVGDYALVAERTDFCISWAMAGAAYFKVTVRGQGGIYTPYIKRPTTIEENPNAAVKMSRVIQAIEEWAYEYENKNKYEYSGGEIVPKVNIGAVRGGLPYKPSKTIGVCSIYVDVRLPPFKGPLEVREELKKLIEGLNMSADVDIYLFRRGYVGENVTKLVESVEKAHEYVFKEKPKRIDSGTTSMWRDINVFNEMGIPSVTYGPGASEFYTGLRVDDLSTTSKLYAMIALDICNQAKVSP